MPTIEISQTTLERLKLLADPFTDTTPEAVILKLLDKDDGGVKTSLWEPVQNQARRAKPGEFTRHQDFKQPLLKVLAEAGGQLPAEAAIDRVGEVMRDRLTEKDLVHLKSGEVRWRNNVRWARDRLVKVGRLDKNAPYGVWRLAG